MKKNVWLVGFALCFAVFIVYIAAVLIVKSLLVVGGLVMLVLMPLFVLAVSYAASARLQRLSRAPVSSVFCPLCGLCAAGLLHLAADKIVNGFSFEVPSALFDLFILLVCAAGGIAAVRFFDIREKRDKKRRRFDD